MSAEHPDSQTPLIDRINAFFARIAGVCFDYRYLATPIFVIVAAGVGYVATGLEGDASYESFFDEDDNTFRAYEDYREDFGSDEVAYIGFEVIGAEQGVFDVAVMEKLVRLTEALEDEVPFVYDVTSLANAELTIGREDGIDISKIADD